MSGLFKAYRSYKDGFLPEAGGLSDQPALLIEAFDEINTVSGILDEEDLKRSRNQDNAQGNQDGWVSVRDQR